jgi:hypothetical protein
MPKGARHEVLERTVRAIADRARDAYRLIEEAHEVDPRDESGLVAEAKRLRIELLQTKAELERELGRLLLHSRRGNRRVHWGPGVLRSRARRFESCRGRDPDGVRTFKPRSRVFFHDR